IGCSIGILTPPDRGEEKQEALDRIRSGRSVGHFETVRIAKDGTLIDISITVSPIRDGNGTVIGASKIGRDITERRRRQRAEEDLLERERAARTEATDV